MKDKLIEKQKEYIRYLLRYCGGYNDSSRPQRQLNYESEIAELEKQAEEQEKKPKRKSRYIPRVKICAGCGSIAHSNPGHDIT